MNTIQPTNHRGIIGKFFTKLAEKGINYECRLGNGIGKVFVFEYRVCDLESKLVLMLFSDVQIKL